MARKILQDARCVGGFDVNPSGKFYGVQPHSEHFQRLQVDNEFRKHGNGLTMQQILLRSVGLTEFKPKYDLQLKDINHEHAIEILNTYFGKGEHWRNLIGLNIGTSEKGKLKRWPVTSFVDLARQLSQKKNGHRVVVLSGPEDKELHSEISAILAHERTSQISILPNNIEVGDFMAIVNRLFLLVTADTFAFHVAKAQEVSTVLLAGPMPHQEAETSFNDKIIGPTLDCSPCYYKCTQEIHGKCMANIEPGFVVDALVVPSLR